MVANRKVVIEAAHVLPAWPRSGRRLRAANGARPCRSSEASEIEAAEEAKAPEEPALLGAPAEPEEPAAEGLAGPAGTSLPLARVAPRRFRLLFTCKVCEHRNLNMISRIAYQQGIVIVTCPGCTSRHLISDKTGLLDYGLWDVEMLAQHGESVTRLSPDGFRRITGPAASMVSPAEWQQRSGAAASRKINALAAGHIPGASADTGGDGDASAQPALLVRNADGVLEAIHEEKLGLASAAEFLADDSAGSDISGTSSEAESAE